MSSSLPGNNTLRVEVTNISSQGLMLLWCGEELFLAYDDFPWFKDKSKKQISNVQAISAEHFYWPDLDVDLELEAIHHPEKFPLIASIR